MRGSAFALGDLIPDGRLRRLPCWRKDSHDTYEEATAHLTRLKASGRLYDAATIEIYRCRHCDKWHVGHDRTKERDMTDIRAALANGGVVAVFLGDNYSMPKDYVRHPQVRAVHVNTLVPGGISSTINGNVRAAVLTERIDPKLYLSLSGELRRRHITFVLRKTEADVQQVLDDALRRPEPIAATLPKEAPKPEPAPAPDPPPETPQKGRVVTFLSEHLSTVSHLSAAEAGRRLYPLAIERGIQTTPASVEQGIRVLRQRERPPIAVAENQPHTTPTTATDAPAALPAPPPPAAPVQPPAPPSQALAALHALDDALSGLTLLREWVAQVDAEVTALRNDNAQLRARVDLLKESFSSELRAKLDLLDTI